MSVFDCNDASSVAVEAVMVTCVTEAAAAVMGATVQGGFNSWQETQRWGMNVHKWLDNNRSRFEVLRCSLVSF